MKHIRIQIDGNKSYLVYQRGLITEYVLITKSDYIQLRGNYRSKSYTGGIKDAYSTLKSNVSDKRIELRDRDKLERKETGSILRLLRQKRRRFAEECFNSKKPINSTKHVGVEIEFISTSDRKDISIDLAAAGVFQFVHLKHDGSVSGGNSGECDGSCRENCECADCGDTHYCDSETECNRRSRNYGHSITWEFRYDCTECVETETIDDCNCGEGVEGKEFCKGDHPVCQGHCPGHSCAGYDDHERYQCNCECNCEDNSDGHEIAIVAKHSEISEVVTKVCKVLAKHNAYVNSTCGLHVHVDARRRDQHKMFANLVKAQKLLFSMVPQSRKENGYCDVNDSGLSMDSYEGRYWGINPASYEEHKTIEVRLHSGTVNAKKIINWINLLQKIAYARKMIQIDSLYDLTSTVELSDDLIQYIKTRVTKFKSQHRSNSIDIGHFEIVSVDNVISDTEAEAA